MALYGLFDSISEIYVRSMLTMKEHPEALNPVLSSDFPIDRVDSFHISGDLCVIYGRESPDAPACYAHVWDWKTGNLWVRFAHLCPYRLH